MSHARGVAIMCTRARARAVSGAQMPDQYTSTAPDRDVLTERQRVQERTEAALASIARSEEQIRQARINQVGIIVLVIGAAALIDARRRK